MITIFKWSVVNAEQLSEMLFQNDLEIQALEKEKAVLQKTANELHAEVTAAFQKLNETQEIAAQVPELKEQIAELDKEVLQLQKSTFVPLSPTDDTPAKVPAVKRNGGRKKAVTQ